MQDTHQEVIIMVVAAMTVFLTLTSIVVFILLFYQKKKFSHRQQMGELQNNFRQGILQAQLETQENTFRQISEELHDNVGQLLSTVNMLLGITERGLLEPSEPLSVAMTTVAQAIRELRSFSQSLSMEWLDRFDLLENTRNELDRLNASGIIRATISTNVAELPLDPQEQVMLFRVLQESLQNCIKHAKARLVVITVGLKNGTLTITVDDDGRGFDPENAAGGGIGMMNMRHRVALLKGVIDWSVRPERGTRITISLPIKPIII
jgi:signal transduction histidine kinase